MNSFFGLLIKFALVIFMFLGLFYFYKKILRAPLPPNISVTHHTILEEINTLGRLELISYHFKDIVEYQKEQTNYPTVNFFLPKAKAVLIVSGEAVGCIDLTKIREQDIVQSKDTVTIMLPRPELCLYKIDHQHSKVYDVSSGYFVEQGLMVSDAFKAAEIKMKQSALEMGILEDTKINAQKILVPLLKRLSGKTVILKNQ